MPAFAGMTTKGLNQGFLKNIPYPHNNKEAVMTRYIVFFLPLLYLAGCTPAPEMPKKAEPALDASHYVTRYVKEAKFEDVKEDLMLAIQNRGLVVDHTSQIHEMLERTGKDLGRTTPIFKDAVAFSFCSAVVSRKIMEADPHSIAFCPFVIAAYSPVNEPEKVYVTYRRPPMTGTEASNAALKELEALLDGIAREAIGKQ